MTRFGIRPNPTGRAESAQSRDLFITTLFTFQSALQQISGAFQKSETIRSDFTDVVRRFWEMYQLQAKEYDAEFLAMHNGDADIAMIFAGLFCAVCATFVIFIQPQLAPDPNDITHALLAALITTMNGTIPPGLPTPSPPNPPSSSILWSQSLLYASLAIGLYAALGAVMGKQWLNHYDRVGIRGTTEDRGKERQRKLESLMKWHFHSVLESLPFLLELSLFLFGVGLSAYLWDQQKSIGILYIAINAIGAILYVSLTVAAAWYPDCPFQTPFSLRLRQSSRRSILFLSLLWWTIFFPVINQSSSKVGQQIGAFHQQYTPTARQWVSKIRLILGAYVAQPVYVVWKTVSRLFAVTSCTASSSLVRLARQRSHLDVEALQPEPVIETIMAAQGPNASQAHSPRTVWAELKGLFGFGRPRGGTQTQPTVPSAPQSDQATGRLLKAWAEIETSSHSGLAMVSPPPSTNPSDATSIVWILDTCTDPAVEAVTLEYILSIDWPHNFDFRPLLDRFFLGFIKCFEIDEDGDIVELLTPAAREPERNATYGEIFLFLYWYARSIASDSVTTWQCPLVRGQHRKMGYNTDRVSHDELTYLYLLIKETIDLHLIHQRRILDLLAVVPGPSVLDNMSPTAAVAFSRYWTYSLQHTSDEQDLWTCYKHVLAMSPHIPMILGVLTHYSTVFAQAVGYVWKHGRLEESDFDINAMLSRMCDIQDDMSSFAATPHHFFNLPHGRYISTFFLFLSYCAQSSWRLRLRLREEHVSLWCLNVCQSFYAGMKNGSFPMSLSVWASCMLRLALVIMDNNGADSNISIDPLSDSRRGEGTSLSSGHKQALTPHLSWIMAYSTSERHVIFTENDSVGPLPIVVGFPMMRDFIISLQRIRFCVMIRTLDRGFPVEAHSLLSKTYLITWFPPRLDDPSTKLYNTMILTLRQQLHSLTQAILSNEVPDAQSLVVGWGAIYQLVLATTMLARDAVRDKIVEDILVMLGDLSQRVPDLLHGSSFEHREGLDSLIWAYDKNHTVWVHANNHPIVRALAQILLTSSGVHRLPWLDPDPYYEYDEDCDQRMALAIVCAAWNSPLDLTEHADGEKRRVKISRAAVENTLTILANTSNDVLEEMDCCIRSVLQHPRRGEPGFDYPFSDEVGRDRVDEVYRLFRLRLEALRSGNRLDLPIPISEPTRAGDGAAVPVPPTIPNRVSPADHGPAPAHPAPVTGDGPALSNAIPNEEGRGSPPVDDQEPSSSLGVAERGVPGPCSLPGGSQATVAVASGTGAHPGDNQE